jgi:hypothetical protein
MIRVTNRFVLGAALLTCTVIAQAKKKNVKPPPKDPQDEIEVVGHIPLNNGPVRRFLITKHYSGYYLYVEQEGGRNVTLIDVSKITQPVVLAHIAATPDGGSGSLVAVAGTAALISEQTANAPVAASQTVRIMDFSNPEQPKVTREFMGVTAMSKDDQRGLIFLANAEGIWILRQNFAMDPEVEREYTRRVLYDH